MEGKIILYAFTHKEIKSCSDCPFSHERAVIMCSLLNADVEDLAMEEKKHKDCPLKIMSWEE